ncbi:hypothetical protein D5086_013468 [Populus alba]|uniref:Uncharacterized protein n=1 Tax=Populus alba TaxID=43335 RepID=A0ACC4C691_POPAL
MLRMLIALDTKPTRLSERSICSLSNVLSAYLIDVTHCVPEDVDESTGSLHEQTWCCYLLPSFFLFDRSYKLLNLALNVMGSSINGNSSSFYLVIVFVTPRGTQVGYNFASQVSHVHVHVLCYSVFVLQKIDQQKSGFASESMKVPSFLWQECTGSKP